MARPRVLIVNGGIALSSALTRDLRHEGYEVVVARDGEDGLRRAKIHPPDLIILDPMLSLMDGLQVYRELRAAEQTRAVPLLMFTEKAEASVRVVEFRPWGSRSVAKSVTARNMVQRIMALKHRSANLAGTTQVVEHLGVRLDRLRHSAHVNGRRLALTPTEFRLLECLLRQPGRAFTRSEMMDAAIRKGANVKSRTLDVHIRSLRRKLARPDLIETVYGVGYYFSESRR